MGLRRRHVGLTAPWVGRAVGRKRELLLVAIRIATAAVRPVIAFAAPMSRVCRYLRVLKRRETERVLL